MKYFEDLLNKIKRKLSGYKEVHVDISVFFRDDVKEWERFVKEHNPVITKYYDEYGSPELSRSYYLSGETQIAGFKVRAFSNYYPNPDFNQEKWDERERKRQNCRELYKEFLKQKKEIGCSE